MNSLEGRWEAVPLQHGVLFHAWENEIFRVDLKMNSYSYKLMLFRSYFKPFGPLLGVQNGSINKIMLQIIAQSTKERFKMEKMNIYFGRVGALT